MGLPGHTRILLVPEDERSSREFVVSRTMVLCLGLLAALVTGLVVYVLVSYAAVAREARQVPELRRQLADADERLAKVRQLNQQLDRMRAMQENLLVMLGVQRPEVAGGDTLGAWTEEGIAQPRPDTGSTLEQAAAVVMTPPPDLWPVGGFVTREFIPGDTQRGVMPHLGIDIAAPLDTPVRAAGKGRVAKARWDDFLGNFVEIQHGFGYVTVYGHCNRLAVREGDRVDRGQVIGYLGGTGQASAPHLHLEIWKEGVAVDPRTVLPGDPPR